MTTLREPRLREGDHVHWRGRRGVVLRVVEVADERIYEVDLSGGLVAVTLERELQPAFV
jgi:hypothetical protein